MGLKFKGDKPTHKKKRSKLSGSTSTSTSSKQPEQEPEGWVSAPSPSLLLGPSYITLPNPTSSRGGGLCIALQPTTGKVYPYQLPSTSTNANALASTSSSALAHLDPEELEALVVETDATDSEEPTDVYHVWVCTRIPDTNDKITLRSANGKFLASDEMGQVSADREARGPQEEWTIEESTSTSSTSSGSGKRFVLKSMYGKYLGVDQLAGGKLELRCDGEEEGETERWKVSMQGEFVAKAKKQFNERNGIKTKEGQGESGISTTNGITIVGDLGAREKESILRYQARGMRKYVGTEEDSRDLKKAKKEGKLSEAMLDRRMKLKSDRYC